MTKATGPLNTVVPVDKIASTFKDNIDLAVATRGGKILTLTDEWFADCSNLLTATAPISAPGRFVPTGAWYDGWETRRHNAPNHDWCVIQLGYPGNIAGFEIDTSYFTGNHSPFVSVEGFTESSPAKAASRTHEEWAQVAWAPVLTKVALNPGSRHGFKLEQPTAEAFTHVRFCMYPDGGVARLRVYGNVHQFGQPGHVTDIEVDTAHYMGNPPKAVTIEGYEIGSEQPIILLSEAPMTPHRQHFFKVPIELTEKRIAQIKVVMIPDGGIKRVRAWGAAQLPAVQPEGSLVGVRQELPDEHTWNLKK
ncbi:hypothetical protein BGZ95_011103 [Linnemannia exigua]|uniref:Allantoicase domain-containing protein n=1 Tax=Linnemannia exigua TaxID=604196 RepID=A0AAD4DAE6_9FUNG|nr:hypothetical protein BGZ95_011103 [Linnemannia exigua]